VSTPYSSPPTNLRSLQDRLTQAAQRQDVVFGRLQRHVAIIVVAQFAATLTDGSGAAAIGQRGIVVRTALRRGRCFRNAVLHVQQPLCCAKMCRRSSHRAPARVIEGRLAIDDAVKPQQQA